MGAAIVAVVMVVLARAILVALLGDPIGTLVVAGVVAWLVVDHYRERRGE